MSLSRPQLENNDIFDYQKKKLKERKAHVNFKYSKSESVLDMFCFNI